MSSERKIVACVKARSSLAILHGSAALRSVNEKEERRRERRRMEECACACVRALLVCQCPKSLTRMMGIMFVFSRAPPVWFFAARLIN